MPTYCALCKRSFKGQAQLDQHTRNSPAHRKPLRSASQAQDLSQVKIPPIILKQQEQAASSRVKPAKSQQALNAGFRIHTATELIYRQVPNAIASSSNIPQIANPAVKTASQSASSLWSVIQESGYMAVLNALSAHCHTLEELKENGYILHPYNLLDYVNLRKCRQCSSKFLILIIELS